MRTVTLAGAVAIWGLIHSLLASNQAKHVAARVLGARFFDGYRLAYNAFAAVSFVPILLLTRAIPGDLLYVVRAPWFFVMLAGQGVAAALILVALWQTDLLSFLGIRQIIGVRRESGLTTAGLYRWSRHPQYFLGLLILWLTPIMTMSFLTVFAVLTVYLFVGATFEERRLRREFGAAYDEYRSRTPMIFPDLRVRKAPTSRPAGTSADQLRG